MSSCVDEGAERPIGSGFEGVFAVGVISTVSLKMKSIVLPFWFAPGI
jgi:hypothetical protein